MKFFPGGHRVWARLALTLFFVALAAGGFVAYMTEMPGSSFSGTLPALSAEDLEIKANLNRHVSYLAGTVGERNLIAYESLQKTAQYIEDALKRHGYEVKSQEYVVEMKKVRNLTAEIRGGRLASEIVVIGAHYDTVEHCPGADDNTSGVAGLLELARLLKDSHPARTLRFVAFVNEEDPWFQTKDMGSWVYAKQAHRLYENIVAAISVESIGTYSDAEGSQQYPDDRFKLLYPSKGDFVAFVGNVGSRELVREAIRSFRSAVKFPSEGGALPEFVTGVSWSDHWSFWQEGYPGIEVTDTPPFRNKNYHMPTDTPDTLDYERMARVVHGLVKVVLDLGK